MSPAAFTLCLAAGLVLYTYALYPLLLGVMASLVRPRTTVRIAAPSSVSVVLAARNEASRIGRRVREFAGQIATAGVEGEIIVVSDGSTDGTASVARQTVGVPVRVIDIVENVGKAAALSAGCAAARNQIVIFGDARQRWSPDALQRLLENFTDPRIGAVGGELMLEDANGVMAGVGLYWRYEKWIRQHESRVGSTVGVSGAIAAVRRELFTPIPAGTILDDVYWPLCVAMRGSRVVWDARARAFDELPLRPADEFRRKVRTLSGNFQLLGRLPHSLIPWRNPLWWQFLSHKLARLLVPWALLFMLFICAISHGVGYRIALWAQLAGYGIGLAGIVAAGRLRIPLLAAAASFLVLNASAWVAFWVWVSGRAGRSWRPTLYEPKPAGNVS